MKIYAKTATIERIPLGNEEEESNKRSFTKDIGSAETLETDFESIENEKVENLIFDYGFNSYYLLYLRDFFVC